MQAVIIGNGVAGITAAMRLRKLKPDWTIKVISGESDYYYSRPALMYIYMGHMRFADTKPYEDWYWDEMRIERVRAWVTSIDSARQQVILDGQPSLPYDKLLIATGSQPNKFGWPGQDLERVQGFYSLQDLHKLERATPGLKRAVIVGGGLIGIELAEMLHTRGVPVSLLVRESSYWTKVMPTGESAMLNKVIQESGIDLRFNSELSEILDDGQGRACGIVTKSGEKIECGLVGLTAGVHPNLTALADSNIPTKRGVLVDESLGTQIPNVFSAGDCAEIVDAQDQHQLWQVWYTGKMQGEQVARVMAGEEAKYDPGIWYNSAKFLDLEWHTYGQITCGDRECEPDLPGCLYWEHPERRLAVRLAHREGKLIGVNALGIRYRHRVCESWIADGRPLDYVIDHLKDANFDPEFFRRYESEMAGILREQIC